MSQQKTESKANVGSSYDKSRRILGDCISLRISNILYNLELKINSLLADNRKKLVHFKRNDLHKAIRIPY